MSEDPLREDINGEDPQLSQPHRDPDAQLHANATFIDFQIPPPSLSRGSMPRHRQVKTSVGAGTLQSFVEPSPTRRLHRSLEARCVRMALWHRAARMSARPGALGSQ